MNKNVFSWQDITKSVLTILVIVLVVWWLSPYISTFFVALLAAYLFNPLVEFCQNKCKVKNRPTAIVISILAFLMLCGLLLWLIIPTMQEELMHAKELLTRFAKTKQLPEWVPVSFDEFTREILNQPDIKKAIDNADLSAYIKDFGTIILKGVSDLGDILFNVFSIFSFLLYFFFILFYFEDFTITKWEKYLPKKWRSFVVNVLFDVDREMKGYFRAQSKIVFAVCILFAIGFKSISLPLGIGLGVFVGLLNYIPYMQLLGIIPAAILALMYSIDHQTNFWLIMGLVLLVFTVVQLIQDIYLTPKIMGEFSGMNPALILLSLSIWGGLMGIIGLIIALPFTSLITAYYKNLIKQTEKI